MSSDSPLFSAWTHASGRYIDRISDGDENSYGCDDYICTMVQMKIFANGHVGYAQELYKICGQETNAVDSGVVISSNSRKFFSAFQSESDNGDPASQAFVYDLTNKTITDFGMRTDVHAACIFEIEDIEYMLDSSWELPVVASKHGYIELDKGTMCSYDPIVDLYGKFVYHMHRNKHCQIVEALPNQHYFNIGFDGTYNFNALAPIGCNIYSFSSELDGHPDREYAVRLVDIRTADAYFLSTNNDWIVDKVHPINDTTIALLSIHCNMEVNPPCDNGLLDVDLFDIRNMSSISMFNNHVVRDPFAHESSKWYLTK